MKPLVLVLLLREIEGELGGDGDGVSVWNDDSSGDMVLEMQSELLSGGDNSTGLCIS